MRNPQKGNRVEITTGKHAGQVGTITGIEGSGRCLVQIPGLPYERSYDKEHLEYKGRIEVELTSGEARRRRIALLVRQGKMCPSYPHQCNGDCINTVYDGITEESEK
jgi:hypothetical protein